MLVVRCVPVRGVRLGVVGAIGVALAVVAAGCTQRVDCSQAVPDAVFTGVLRSERGNTVEFAVETVTPSYGRSPTGRGAPLVVVGAIVSVFYDAGTAQFLRVGERYSVSAIWIGGRFVSDVHTADRPCSGGTTYADGRNIDTALWKRARVRRFVLVAAIAIHAVATIGTAVSRWQSSRRRRRRRPNAHEQRALEGLERLRRR